MRMASGIAFTFLLFTGLCGAQKTEQVGSQANGGTLVATWQIVRPAGDTIALHGRPIDLVLAPDGKTLFVKDNRGLVVLDAATWTLRQELKFPASGGSLHGIVVSRDGRRIYATNATELLMEATVGANGRLTWTREMHLPAPKIGGDPYPCGLALTPDEKQAVVCLSRSNTLAVVDMAGGKTIAEMPVGVAPFDVALSADGKTAYVSNWGGRHPKSGETTANSSGTPTLTDGRGVASSGTVSFVNLETREVVAEVETGLHPSDLEVSPDGRMLAVANANSDTVSLLNTATRRVIETISTRLLTDAISDTSRRPLATLPFGSAPNALAFRPDGKTLFVANGGNNALAVIALDTSGGKSQVRGYIPTGWYPGGVVMDGKRLFVANVKGLGSRGVEEEKGEKLSKGSSVRVRNRPSNARGWNVYDYLGTVNRIPLPVGAELAAYTAQVRRDARVPEILRDRERRQSGKTPVPVPAHIGEPSVFSHVVYILKENRTYDQVLGDMKQGNGDPKLCLFGRKVTPNHHALAEQFALLDNFYCNGVLSADGHSWATEGNVTDHLEKAFGGFTRSYTFGDDPLTYSSSGFLWDNVLAHGLSFRNYGEMDYTKKTPDVDYATVLKDWQEKTNKIKFAHNIGVENLLRYSNPDAPGWNMDIPDVLRADVFLKELRGFEKTGTFPHLTLLYLPNDHTSGATPGSPTPRAYLADNDLALGRVIEGLSKSKFWPKTCIFVIEDDPQDGFDHVDGHRSLCLVISPYTKRGAVIHDFYNQTSVLHTMEHILGLPAMNQMDAAAPLMRACFTAKPDLTPYAALPNTIPLGERNPLKSALRGKRLYWAQQSEGLRFDTMDAANEDTLNRILWHSVKGVNAPYPAALAGSHGKGLKALHLHLANSRSAHLAD